MLFSRKESVVIPYGILCEGRVQDSHSAEREHNAANSPALNLHFPGPESPVTPVSSTLVSLPEVGTVVGEDFKVDSLPLTKPF